MNNYAFSNTGGEVSIDKVDKNRTFTTSKARKENEIRVSPRPASIEGVIRIFDDSERRYNTNTDIISNTFDNMNSKDSLLKNQKKIVSSNSDKIQEMNNDILSLRRQLELSYNEYKKRSFVIFILKNIFVYLMIALLIGILMNKKLLGNL